MPRERLLKMVQISLFMAIIVVMTFIPQVGYIVYGGLSITTLHIPVIIGAIFLGPLAGTILGATWGITCLMYAMMNGTADAVIFLNPLISVVPRIIVGFATGWYFVFFNKLNKKIAVPITAALGTFTNTALVMGAIYLFAGDGLVTLVEWVRNIILITVAMNGAIEIIAAIFLATVICRALFAAGIGKKA